MPFLSAARDRSRCERALHADAEAKRAANGQRAVRLPVACLQCQLEHALCVAPVVSHLLRCIDRQRVHELRQLGFADGAALIAIDQVENFAKFFLLLLRQIHVQVAHDGGHQSDVTAEW